MNKLILFSPAKINLFLRILHKRKDDYHELASLFQTISLGDSLEISLSSNDKLTCTDKALPVDPSNLVWKAADLFRRKTQLDFCFHIHLKKNIPYQAGLGGGSSNAATTLWGLNQLLAQPVSSQDLMSWSADIGSDIPFFFTQGTAYITGKGEIINPIPHLSVPKEKLWIIKPQKGLATPAVYRALNLEKLPHRDPLTSLEQFLNYKPDYYNDLEESAFSLMPELAVIKKRLLHLGYFPVLLSGSGSAFFCMGHENPYQHFSNTWVAPGHFITRDNLNWYTE